MATIEPILSHRWPESQSTLVVAACDTSCHSLGPGTRAVLWLQGCCFRCPGCVAPEMLSFQGGVPTQVESIVHRLCNLREIDGITFSGGEPFMQARALVCLIDAIKKQRTMSFMSYTGFTIEELRERHEDAQIQLLSRLDILVDGRYLRDQHATLLWRGSKNQRIHFLSDRHISLRNSIDDNRVLLDLTIDEDGSFRWAGISPRGFQQVVERGMRDRGVAARKHREPQ